MLRELTTGDTDARIEAGVDPARAEYLALVELGVPDVLVANYLDRPRYLIGPRLFPTWKRLLRVLALTVIPTVGLAFALAQTLAQRPFGEIFGSTLVTLTTLTVHLGFWTTLVFAVLDRALGGKPISQWTPESLPAATEPPRHQMRADVIANLSFVALFAFGIFAHTLLLPFRDPAGETILLFQPGTWAWLKWYLIGLLILEVVFWISLFLRGHWNYLFAALRTVLSFAFAIPAARVLLTDRLVLSEVTSAAGVYVGMTRGRQTNRLHVVAKGMNDARARFIEAMERDPADRGLVHATTQAVEAVRGLISDGPVRLVTDEIALLDREAEQVEGQAERWARTAAKFDDLPGRTER